MALTNKQIIDNECILAGIIEEVNTYPGWQRAGYQVKNGAKACFKAQIWKPCKMSKKAAAAAAENGETIPDQKLQLVWAYFFKASDVVKNI